MAGLFGELLKKKWMMTEEDYRASLLDFLEKTPKRDVQTVGEVIKENIKERRRRNEKWSLRRSGVVRTKAMMAHERMESPIAKAARRNRVSPGTTTQ